MAVKFENVCEPDVALMPLHPPEAVQAVALVEVQVTVELPSQDTDAELTSIVTVGTGVGAAATENRIVAEADVLPAVS